MLNLKSMASSAMDGFADPMFPKQCVTYVELRLQKISDFYEQPHFTMEHFKFWEAGGGG